MAAGQKRGREVVGIGMLHRHVLLVSILTNDPKPELKSMRSILLVFVAATIAGCQQQAAPSAYDPEYERQVEEHDRQQKEGARQLRESARQLDESARQLDESARQQQETTRQLEKAVEQQERFDRLLERSEQQADRYDAILDKLEKPLAPGGS
jgi:flagellar motility protein MotE (MotC chaperone)